MNIRDYIKSGIIESCVLGIAPEQEQREFESLCNEQPEIRKAKYEFELALEEQLMKEALTPPEDLKHKILLSLNIADPATSNDKVKVDDIPVRKINVWRWIAVACLILLAGIGYWMYTIRNEYTKLQATNSSLKNRLVESNRDDAIMALHPIVQRPSVKWSTMVEPTNPGHCMAHVYWDSLSTNTYLLLGNIPKPLSDKQFQLWSLQDNQHVNLGLFDIKKEGQLIQMKDQQKAKSFVITIEPIGGSATPTLQATYAVGEL